MIINYQGKSYFKIQSGGNLILIDPTDQRSFRGATLILNTIYPPLIKNDNSKDTFFIDTQGEYDVKETRIYGKTIAFEEEQEKIAYEILFEEIKIGIIPALQKEPDIKNLENLEDSDILILPLGAKKYLNPNKIANIARQLEPSIIIPYFIDIEENPKELLKELGKEASPLEKLTIKKKDINPKEMKVCWIKSK